MKKLLDKLFPKRLLFVILSPNAIRIKDIESGRSIQRKSLVHFSSERMIVSDFKVAEGFVRDCIGELLKDVGVSRKPIKVVLQIQDKEKLEVSAVECMVYQDLFQHAGAAYFWMVEHQNEMIDAQIVDIAK